MNNNTNNNIYISIIIIIIIFILFLFSVFGLSSFRGFKSYLHTFDYRSNSLLDLTYMRISLRISSLFSVLLAQMSIFAHIKYAQIFLYVLKVYVVCGR